MKQKRSTHVRKSRYTSKTARPEHLQHTNAQNPGTRKRRRKRRFRLKSQVKIGGIIILALLIIFAGYRTFFIDKKTGTGKAQVALSKNAKEADNLVEMEEIKEIALYQY